MPTVISIGITTFPFFLSSFFTTFAFLLLTYNLYNTNPKWREARDKLDLEFMDDKHPSWLCRHLKDCVEKYIDLMVDAETRDLLKDKVLVPILGKLYGEQYLEQFRKEEK